MGTSVFTLELPLLQEFLDFQEAHRSSVMDMLARKYHGVAPLLIKVEGLVHQTNTGCSPELEEYYQYWEKRTLDAIVKVEELFL